jgi:hypothetical protein
MVGVVCDQSIHSTVLSRNYRFWVMCQVNIDFVLLQIDRRRVDLWEFHARQCNSAYHPSLNERDKSSVQWSIGE